MRDFDKAIKYVEEKVFFFCKMDMPEEAEQWAKVLAEMNRCVNVVVVPDD